MPGSRPDVEGINTVMMGQWEYQIFAKVLSLRGSNLVGSLSFEVARKNYNIAIDLHPKPIKGDWNIQECMLTFQMEPCVMKEEKNSSRKSAKNSKNIERHISVYGADNNQRLTGLHETQSIDKFVRVLIVVPPSGFCNDTGRLERSFRRSSPCIQW